MTTVGDVEFEDSGTHVCTLFGFVFEPSKRAALVRTQACSPSVRRSKSISPAMAATEPGREMPRRPSSKPLPSRTKHWTLVDTTATVEVAVASMAMLVRSMSVLGSVTMKAQAPLTGFSKFSGGMLGSAPATHHAAGEQCGGRS